MGIEGKKREKPRKKSITCEKHRPIAHLVNGKITENVAPALALGPLYIVSAYVPCKDGIILVAAPPTHYR